MKVKAKRVKDGFLIPLIEELKDKDEIVVEIKESAKQKQEWSDEYIEKHWRKLGMNTNSPDTDDDERLYEAAERFYSEKYNY